MAAMYINPGKCSTCHAVYAKLVGNRILDDGVAMGVPRMINEDMYVFDQCAECQLADVIDQWVEEHDRRRERGK